MFDAFTAEALAAMEKPDMRQALYARLDGMGCTTHRGSDSGGGANALPTFLEAQVSKLGVPFHRYRPLSEAEVGGDEDELCEYDREKQASIAENRQKLQELGLL